MRCCFCTPARSSASLNARGQSPRAASIWNGLLEQKLVGWVVNECVAIELCRFVGIVLGSGKAPGQIASTRECVPSKASPVSIASPRDETRQADQPERDKRCEDGKPATANTHSLILSGLSART